MANDLQPLPDFLRKPLSVFDLPTELLSSLRVRNDHGLPPALREDVEEPNEGGERVADKNIASSTSCSLCHSSFSDVVEQRAHVKSDFHRYNLKITLKGSPPLDEATFNKLIGDLDESISGSESSNSGSEDDEGTDGSKDSTLTSLLKHRAKTSRQHTDEGLPTNRTTRRSENSPIIWMSSPQLPDDTSVGFYRALLTETERDHNPVDVIKRKQIPAMHSGVISKETLQRSVGHSSHYFLCMIGGGHFAAMIVSLASEIRMGSRGHEEWHAIIKAHKTFHRYTTRRKQGGSQSTSDNAKGKAHSAGSSIRRHNEMALEADVRELLSEWKEMINTAELIFIRATAAASRKTLYGPYEGQTLRADDHRLRGFPFSTRRATQSELMTAFTELTRLKIRTICQSAAQTAVKMKEDIKKAAELKSIPSDSLQQPTGNDDVQLQHTSQIQTLIRRAKIPALLTYLTNNDLSPDFLFVPTGLPQNHHAPTPLHLAASGNSPALVLALLTKARANATLVNGENKTPFDIAGDAKTRDAFRVARHLLGELAVDWRAAHVPSALSEQEADDRQATGKAREKQPRPSDGKSILTRYARRRKDKRLPK